MKGRLLIVDDHKQVLKALIQLLEPEFDKVTGLSNPNQIVSCTSKEEFDVVLLDMNFSAGVNTGNEGIYWLNRILKTDPLAVVQPIKTLKKWFQRTFFARICITGSTPL